MTIWINASSSLISSRYVYTLRSPRLTTGSRVDGLSKDMSVAGACFVPLWKKICQDRYVSSSSTFHCSGRYTPYRECCVLPRRIVFATPGSCSDVFFRRVAFASGYPLQLPALAPYLEIDYLPERYRQGAIWWVPIDSARTIWPVGPQTSTAAAYTSDVGFYGA